MPFMLQQNFISKNVVGGTVSVVNSPIPSSRLNPQTSVLDLRIAADVFSVFPDPV